MKTNASPKTIIKAVENVSSKLYENNVIFRKYPEKITKHVVRFTLRTKDANKPGSLVMTSGQRQPKANWEVHENVMKEIFELNPRNNIYIDTLYGRQFNPKVEAFSPDPSIKEEEDEGQPEEVINKNQTPPSNKKQDTSKKEVEEKPVVQSNAPIKRKEYIKKNGSPNMSKLIKTLKYLLAHPELLE